MIWATVSSQSCFCWLYRASLSLAEKYIINLILVLTICWCPHVIFCVVEKGCLLWQVHSLGKTISLCPASFCTPRPNLPVTPIISWLPTFAFHIFKTKNHKSKWLTDILHKVNGRNSAQVSRSPQPPAEVGRSTIFLRSYVASSEES